MRPAHIVRRAADYLERHDVESPLPTAEQLLANVLGTDRSGLYTREEPLRGPEAKAFGRALCRRCAGAPTQHVTGTAGFRHLTLTVRPGVFVPRPETELVVDVALAAIAGTKSPVVVDVGTGSGAIALAVKQERPDARVWAVDRSPEAVDLARENATHSGLAIDVSVGDLLEDLDPAIEGIVDLVVSNPPYIEPEAYGSVPPEVRADPVGSVVGGAVVYPELFMSSSTWLRPGGAVVVEIGEEQATTVVSMARDAGAVAVSVHRDLAHRDRVVAASWP
jgi:release factor glutamine methyltransferase